jgi:predicted alpha/beta superfamily hydrolase/ketosteroid isomerase-like protein
MAVAMRRILIAFAAAVLASAPAPQVSAQEPVELAGAVVHTLDVHALPGVPYQLLVAAPADAGPRERVPVVYLLDAYNQFGMVLQIYRILRLSGDVPPLVLVGISYDGGWDDYIRIRARDFTPSPLSPTEVADRYGRGLASYTPESGRASDFLELLATEIIPFVERRYPGQSADRTLLGYSYGGLFAAHVLLTRPELFNRYLMGSPAVWWHNDEVLALPDPEASSVRPGTRVFATVGSDETELMMGAWRRLVERLDGLSGVEVAAMEFPGEHHMSVHGAMYSRALRTLFRPADMVGSEGHAGVPDVARDSIDQVTDRLAASISRKDSAGAADGVPEDGTIVYVSDGAPIRGFEDADVLERFYASVDSIEFAWTEKEVVFPTPRAAVVTARASIKVLGREGGWSDAPAVFTLVYRLDAEGRWRYVTSQKTSLPPGSRG